MGFLAVLRAFVGAESIPTNRLHLGCNLPFLFFERVGRLFWRRLLGTYGLLDRLPRSGFAKTGFTLFRGG